MSRALAAVATVVVMSASIATASAQAPVGEIKGSGLVHTPASAAEVVARADVALPAAVTGGKPFFGKWKDVPAGVVGRAPTVLFLHGSSGLSLKAIEEWQRWLADRGWASMAPDSFALPDRMTYKSPIDKATYEKLHGFRGSEIDIALAALKGAAWADPAAIVLAGASEGAVPVARNAGAGFRARMIFSWSCETNYFVEDHRTAPAPEIPVLNVISSVDPFFSPANSWLGNPEAKGHCAAAFAAHKAATIVLVPGAPHTLLNLPQVRDVTEAFLKGAVGPRP